MNDALKNNMRAFVVAILAVGMAFAMLTGCGSDDQAATSEAATSEAAESSSAAAVEIAEGAIVIGDATADSDSLLVTNEMGVDITSVTITTVGSQTGAKTLDIQGGVWPNGQKAQIFYGKGSSLSSHEVKVTYDGGEYTLHNLPLGSIDEATLRTDGTYAYLSYSTGNMNVSTLGTEKALAAQAAAAEASAQDEQAVEAVQEPEYTEEYVDDTYYYYYDDDEDADDEDADDEDADDDEYYDDEDYDDEYTDDEEYYDDEDSDDEEYYDEEEYYEEEDYE